MSAADDHAARALNLLAEANTRGDELTVQQQSNTIAMAQVCATLALAAAADAATPKVAISQTSQTNTVPPDVAERGRQIQIARGRQIAADLEAYKRAGGAE